MASEKSLAPSRALAAKLVFAAFEILQASGRQLPSGELMTKVEQKVVLDDWARESLKSGGVRWRVILQFFTIDCVKAGYLIKKDRIWYLTPEGETAMKLGPLKLLDAAGEAYDKWRETTPKADVPDLPVQDVDASHLLSYDEIEQKAAEGLQAFIAAKNAYEFQDLVAALLRGMGYFTPFVAPKGKDGGVDVVAYRDPLGTQSPRIQAQIKHRESSATVQEIRELMGLLQKDGNVGIFVSTGGFTPDARAAARTSHAHIELIDLDRFLTLWQDFYDKMVEEDKALLPLRPIFFLAQQE
jgi:restriction system protein